MKKNINTPPYEHEELFFMTPEEQIWEVRRLESSQCDFNINQKKYSLCLLYHLSPSGRKCISKEYLDGDDDEPTEEILNCIEKNKVASMAYNLVLEAAKDIFVVHRPYISKLLPNFSIRNKFILSTTCKIYHLDIH